MVEEFLTCYSPDFIPPRRYELLRRFLERTGARSFPEAIKSFPADKRILAMLDDRCDPCVSVSLPSGARFLPLRQWESDGYMQRPPEGLYIHVYGADAETLHVNLQKDDRGFVLQFHLPYYALRPDQPDLRDSRGLRKHRYFRPPGEEKQDCIYEAQLSLIVFGVDDFFWTAYFCEDTYFGGQDLVANCLQDEVDGPSLGRRMHKFPIWDPRYYFLSILATRTGQITLEWTVLVQSLENVLDRHGEIDQENLNTFLENDPTLKKTKDYTWILCILRRLRNGLARVIAALIAFDNNNTVYFDLDADGPLQGKFRECFSQVRQHTAELEALRMILEQRMEIMEKMSGVLVNASSLAESITATRQGDNIRLLTYITIGAFSMNQVANEVAWWKYWVSVITLKEDVLVLLAVPTPPSVHVAYLTGMQLEHTIWLHSAHLGCTL
ncbi:hypothetical protein CNMCM5623_003648 [Aspergillus felis]|uniref:Uncharacterized protein n=1 Tax=Aspergillus felis TaxID=1287682 RepID=A0A8H6PPR6_9EURO|nr:hypothetical protein CNMCM5623_003648 [Aspergillus felis]